MKRIFLFLVITMTTLAFLSCGGEKQGSADKPAARGEGARWYTFAEGFARATKEKKPIVIDFYADWCKWCKVMEKETFSDREVIAKLSKDYIPIRIHTDRPNSERIKFRNHNFTISEFSAMLGVRGLPTLVFMDSTGKPITKIPGFVKKDVFLPLLGYITEECYLKNIPFESYLKKKVCRK